MRSHTKIQPTTLLNVERKGQLNNCVALQNLLRNTCRFFTNTITHTAFTTLQNELSFTISNSVKTNTYPNDTLS